MNDHGEPHCGSCLLHEGAVLRGEVSHTLPSGSWSVVGVLEQGLHLLSCTSPDLRVAERTEGHSLGEKVGKRQELQGSWESKAGCKPHAWPGLTCTFPAWVSHRRPSSRVCLVYKQAHSLLSTAATQAQSLSGRKRLCCPQPVLLPSCAWVPPSRSVLGDRSPG